MKKIAQWQDPRSKLNYRLAGDHSCFVLEVEGKDAVGDPRWTHKEEFDRVGAGADLTAILGEGLQTLANELRQAELTNQLHQAELNYSKPSNTVIDSPNPVILVDTVQPLTILPNSKA